VNRLFATAGSAALRSGLVVFVVAGLTVELSAVPALSAQSERDRSGRPSVEPGQASSPRRDVDRDRIYDDLEADLAKRKDDERVAAIVLFNDPVDDNDVAGQRAAIGDFPIKARWSVVKGYSAELTKGQVAALARRSDVVQIEPETAVRISMATARASYGVDKAVADFGVTGDGDGAARSYGASDVATCVIDTGIDAGHADLDQGQVVAWRDEVNQRTTPYDDHGHGTHVAGIVAGQGDANAAHRGVAPGSALVGVKALDSAGSGTSTAIVNGIDFCVANWATHNIRVLNMSLGTSGSSDGTDAMSVAVANAFDNGLLPIVAAGNAGSSTSTVGSPGAAAKALTVCSMADPGEKGFFVSSFSSRGLTADGRTKPDLCAPGHRITAPSANSGTGYVTMSGTSMATPFAAGVAALMLDANSGQSPAQLKDNLVATAEDRITPGADVDTGAGRLQAYEAIKRAGGLSGTGPEVPDRHLGGTQSLAATGASDTWTLDVASTAHPIALTLIVPDASATRDFELNLFDPSGTRVARSQTANRQETVAFTPAATGRYTAQVLSVAGSGEYQLDFSYKGAAPVNESATTTTTTTSTSTTTTSSTTTTTVAPTPAAVGPGSYEEDSTAVAYTGTWTRTTYSADSGGASSYAGPSAAAELRFSGSTVRWVGRRQPNFGIADVFIDGAKVASVDTYSPTFQANQVLFERTGLASGEHTIRIVATGTKNASSSGTVQRLDAFVVLPAAVGAGTYEEDNGAVAYTGTWTRTTYSGDSGGASSYAGPSAAAELRFSGSTVRWVGRRQSNFGIADVFIDGTKVASVDTYSPSLQANQVLFERTGLGAGEHTIRMVATGAKSASSSGTVQRLDAFVVL